MSNYTFIGALCGIIIGVLICIIFFKSGGNTDGKLRTQYDERQKTVRGKSYRLGFYTYMISAAIMSCISISDVSIPAEDAVIWFTWLFVGMIPMCVHSIWNGAYWGLNNNKTKYIILFAAATVINALTSIVSFMNGRMIVDGKLSTPFINFLCAILFLIVGGTVIIKKIYDDKLESEE